MTLMEIDFDNLVASAFLDEFDRYAKSEEAIAKIRLWIAGDSPPAFIDLMPSQYAALEQPYRDRILEAGSAAPYLDTSTKSNA